MSNYKPAIFQPTIRPDWGGTLDYLSDEEKSQILTAIIKYPSVECNSKFWLGTIKPDLDMQLKAFLGSNAAKARGALCRWGKTPTAEGKDMVTISIPHGNLLKEKEKEKSKENRGGAGGDLTIEEIIKAAAVDLTRKGDQIKITPDFNFPNNPYFNAYRQELPTATKRVETWIRKSQMVGKYITQEALGKLIRKFATK